PTERDMTRDLRNGDLIGATREIGRFRDPAGGIVERETVTIRPASFWNDYRVVASRFYGGATLDPVDRAPNRPRGTYVFVRRDGLDKRYPRELPTAAQPDTKAAAAVAESAAVDKTHRKEPRTYATIRQFAAEKWPDGYADVESRDLVKAVGDALGAKRDVILRALGRRKG